MRIASCPHCEGELKGPGPCRTHHAADIIAWIFPLAHRMVRQNPAWCAQQPGMTILLATRTGAKQHAGNPKNLIWVGSSARQGTRLWDPEQSALIDP